MHVADSTSKCLSRVCRAKSRHSTHHSRIYRIACLISAARIYSKLCGFIISYNLSHLKKSGCHLKICQPVILLVPRYLIYPCTKLILRILRHNRVPVKKLKQSVNICQLECRAKNTRKYLSSPHSLRHGTLIHHASVQKFLHTWFIAHCKILIKLFLILIKIYAAARKLMLKLVNKSLSVRPLTVHLVYENKSRNIVLCKKLPHSLRMSLNPVSSTYDKYRIV